MLLLQNPHLSDLCMNKLRKLSASCEKGVQNSEICYFYLYSIYKISSRANSKTRHMLKIEYVC